jgi:hypothetical protein
LKWTEPSCPAGGDRPTWTSRAAGYETTVRDYLAHHLKDDPDKDAVVDLAETFLAEANS